LDLKIVGNEKKNYKRVEVNNLPKHFIKLMADKGCTPNMFDLPN